MLTFLHMGNCMKCSDLPDWQLNCSIIPQSETDKPYTMNCPSSGKYTYDCIPYEGITCEGDKTVQKSLNCYPTEGKNPGTALCLSIVLGFLGVDRFYLGYPTIGLFKLFTGGFFGLGWYIDIFLIALRLAKPARGGVYEFSDQANFRVRLPGPMYLY